MSKQGIGLWIVVIALLILDIGVHCVRAQDDSSKVVKTQDLQIVNKAGDEVADITTDDKDNWPEIVLYDLKGNPRLFLSADNTGGSVQLMDANGDTNMAMVGDDQPSLGIYKDKKMRIWLGTQSTDISSLELNDADGNERGEFTYSQPDQLSQLRMSDKDNKQVMESIVDSNGALVDVSDKNSTRRAGLTCDTDGVPSVYVADKNGNPLWSEKGPASAETSSGSSDSGSSRAAPRLHSAPEHDR